MTDETKTGVKSEAQSEAVSEVKKTPIDTKVTTQPKTAELKSTSPAISLLILNSNPSPILHLCMESFHQMAADSNSVEYVVVSHNDLEDLERSNLKFVKVENSVGSTEAYNLAAKQAKGNLLWVLTDNSLCVTKGWDKVLVDAVSKHNDNIVYVMVDDNLHNKIEGVMEKYGCTTPIISRGAYDKLGGVFVKEVAGGGADTATYLLWKQTKPDCILNLSKEVNLIYLDKSKWPLTGGKSELTEEEKSAYLVRLL